jgi:hypothetical protein
LTHGIPRWAIRQESYRLRTEKHDDQAGETIFPDPNASWQSWLVLTEFQIFSEFRLLLLCDMKKKGDGKRPPDDSNAVRRVIDIESFSF